MSVLASLPLEGQVVAILGGSGRMGSAAAEEVAGLGADVLLIGRDEAALGRAAAPLGERARTAVADASDEGALAAALRGAGPIDHVVVAVSAGARAGGVADTSPDAARAAFGRLWTSYAVLHLAPEVLPPHGSVTLLSGSSARTPAPGAGVWTALHGAIEALARAAAVDLAPIRVNVVSPGGIGLAPDRQLVPRPGVPSDVGVAVAALIASPAATGAVLDVDSGERRGTWSGAGEEAA